MGMSSLSEDTVEDELGGDIRVDTTDDDGGDQDEDKSALLSPRLRQRADTWGGRVLAHVVVTNSGRYAKEDHLHDCQGCETLSEILRVLHFGNERRVQNLADEEECDANREL